MGILWIASYPRSGSNWLRAIFANLLAETPPVDFADYGRQAPHEASPLWYRQFSEEGEITADPTEKNIRRRHQVQEQLSASFERRDAVLKTHNALVQLHGLPLIRDDLTMSAIYLARDPRDVVASLSTSQGLSIDEAISFIGSSEKWIGGQGPLGEAPMFEVLGNWSEHVKSWARAGSAILRYEDLFERPDAYDLMSSMFGTKTTNAKMREVRGLCSFENLKAKEDEFLARSQTERPPIFRQGKAGAWKDVLTTGQAKRIELNHADVMRRLNYL